MTSNLLILTRSRYKVIFSCAFTVVVVMIGVVCMIHSVASHKTLSNYREMEVIDDLPGKIQMEKYLSFLEKTVYFASGHRVYVDLNLCFGIFLVNVNLKSTIQIRGHLLPAQMRLRLERIVKTTEDIMKYFSDKVQNYLVQLDKRERSRLLTDLKLNYIQETAWPNHLQPFKIDLLNRTKFYTRKQLQRLYFKWPKYRSKVFDFDIENYTPNPAEADACLSLLTQNPVNHHARLTHCQVPYHCAYTTANGTDYGYGITHRLLFLLMAKFSRGCSIFSPTEDKQLVDKLCAKMYNEAEFIAQHDFEIADLVMEHIALCSLEGHAQFLRRSWIDELLDFQTGAGCFNVTRPDDGHIEPKIRENDTWKFMIPDQMIMGESCHAHSTAVASAMLASVVRYMIEKYY